MACGTPLSSAVASRSGRDMVTLQRRDPLSRQPAWDVRAGAAHTRAPSAGGQTLQPFSAPKRHGDSGQGWGGGGSVQQLAPPSKPLTLRAGGGGQVSRQIEARGVGCPSPVKEVHMVRWRPVRGRVLREELVRGRHRGPLRLRPAASHHARSRTLGGWAALMGARGLLRLGPEAAIGRPAPRPRAQRMQRG